MVWLKICLLFDSDGKEKTAGKDRDIFVIELWDFFWAVLISAIAFLGVQAGSSILASNLGNLLGTIVAVVVANLWALKTCRPTSIVLIPAIVMLVSGTIGFRGLASMAEGELLLGMQQFFKSVWNCNCESNSDQKR